MRRAKQIIYGAFYLLVIVGIVALVRFVWFRPAAPAPCPTCLPANLQALNVGEFESFVSSPGHYTFLARVENHNSDYAAKDFSYAFDLFDASGTVLQSFPGASFAYAAEVKYLVLPNVAATVPFDHAGLTVQNTDWVASSTMGNAPQFGNPLPVATTTRSSTTATVTGTLTNNDVSSFAPVYIVAIFYGAAGTPIGASQAQLDAVAPGQTEPFSVSYPVAASSTINPALTKVYGYALRP